MNGIGISYKEWKEDRNLTWYSLRHFGITMRIISGVNVVDVSKLQELQLVILKTLI